MWEVMLPKGQGNFAETGDNSHNYDIAQLFLKSYFHFSFSKLFKGFKVKKRQSTDIFSLAKSSLE